MSRRASDTSAQHLRHVDRKLFKMRELRGAEVVVVDHIPTDVMPADLFTKILSKQLFERHRSTVLNLPGDRAIERERLRRAALSAREQTGTP